MRRRSIPAALTLLLAFAVALSCAHPIVLTQPEIEVTTRPLPPVTTRRVLVVSPSSVQDLADDLALEGDGGTLAHGPAGEASAGSAADGGAGEADGGSEDRAGRPPHGARGVTANIERQLFNAGWDPTPRTALAELVRTNQLAIPMGDLLQRKQAWLESFIDYSPSIDWLFIIRNWRLAWARKPSSRGSGAVACPLVADLEVELIDKSGRLAWRGRIRGSSSDLYELRLKGAGKKAEVAEPDFACVSTTTCDVCDDSTITPEAREVMGRYASNLVMERFAEAPRALRHSGPRPEPRPLAPVRLAPELPSKSAATPPPTPMAPPKLAPAPSATPSEKAAPSTKPPPKKPSPQQKLSPKKAPPEGASPEGASPTTLKPAPSPRGPSPDAGAPSPGSD